MGSLTSSNVCIMLLVIATMASKISSAINATVPALFLFGDSLLDAGTNIFVPNSSAVVNYPPYGETYFRRPTGRFTNGRTVGDFLALSLNLPLVRPYLDSRADHSQGANFASGGSGLLDSTGYGDGVVPLKEQIRQFQQLAAKLKQKLRGSAAAVLSKSLIAITAGSNDIGLNYLVNTTFRQTVPVPEFIASLMKSYEEAIMALYQTGMRKFVVFELGTLGCTPNARMTASFLNETGCLNAANQLALLFNIAVKNLLGNVTATLKDAKIVHGKSFDVFTEMITHGGQYGFVNTTSACCGAGPFNALLKCGLNISSSSPYKIYIGKFPSKYMFWDSVHPTEAAYRIIFQRFWHGNASYIEPFNIRTLVSL